MKQPQVDGRKEVSCSSFLKSCFVIAGVPPCLLVVSFNLGLRKRIPLTPYLAIQAHSHLMDLVGPGKLVHHVQTPSYAYDGLSSSYASVYVIALGSSFDRY